MLRHHQALEGVSSLSPRLVGHRDPGRAGTPRGDETRGPKVTEELWNIDPFFLGEQLASS